MSSARWCVTSPQATAPSGFPEDKVRTLTENANTLKLQAQFEEE